MPQQRYTRISSYIYYSTLSSSRSIFNVTVEPRLSTICTSGRLKLRKKVARKCKYLKRLAPAARLLVAPVRRPSIVDFVQGDRYISYHPFVLTPLSIYASVAWIDWYIAKVSIHCTLVLFLTTIPYHISACPGSSHFVSTLHGVQFPAVPAFTFFRSSAAKPGLCGPQNIGITGED